MPSTTVLLVDWPSQAVPRTLLASGFAVLSANFAEGTASSYSVDAADGGASQPDDDVEVIAPEHEADPRLLIRRLDAMPGRVDVVALFRPQDEHARIVGSALSLGARAVWVQRGTLADDARQTAAAAGLAVIEAVPMGDAVQQLRAVAATE